MNVLTDNLLKGLDKEKTSFIIDDKIKVMFRSSESEHNVPKYIFKSSWSSFVYKYIIIVRIFFLIEILNPLGLEFVLVLP